MLEKINKENISEEEKQIIEKAIEIGFEALSQTLRRKNIEDK